MKLRVAFALILIVSLSTSAFSRLPLKQNDEGEQSQLTAEEEQAARALALKFSERLQETEGNIAPLIPEFFVSDFDERLRDDSCAFTDSHDNLFLCIARNAMRQLSEQDLRRLFVM